MRVYKFIEAHTDEFSVKTLCGVLGVARAGYYGWLSHPLSDRAQEDARLLRLIRTSFIASHGIYGAPRVLLDLRELGACGKLRVERLMRENGSRALHSYRIRHISVPKPPALIPNLLQRQFTVSRPNEAWVTDITYIRNPLGPRHSVWKRRLAALLQSPSSGAEHESTRKLLGQCRRGVLLR